jgi:hypothetical protein|tara:strand:+ start:115 stop:510 length:396 start_codon:yes stop_codon:yes gene_type:complete
MPKNQLFRILPDIEIIHSLLQAFGLTSLNDTNFFTKESLQTNHTIDQLNDMKSELESYYLPCKAKIYIQDINEKRCITILRQFIKVHEYTLISKERYINGNKVSVYRLIEDDSTSTHKTIKEPNAITISFK